MHNLSPLLTQINKLTQIKSSDNLFHLIDKIVNNQICLPLTHALQSNPDVLGQVVLVRF